MTFTDGGHHRPFETLAGPGDEDVVRLDPATAGWDRCGLRVVRLAAGDPYHLTTGEFELFVLPLAGSVRAEFADPGPAEVGARYEARFDLRGRPSVFGSVTDFAYAGRDTDIVLTSLEGAEVALPMARCSRRLPPRYGPAEGVPVEVRGAGTASRQVNNFGVPGVWDHADKLIGVEVITPPGNWSSYPPHKHDASAPCEVVNEEVYLYRIAGPDQVTPSRQGFGIHRQYTGPEHEKAHLEAVDDQFEVRDLDVVLVPHGYHGPCIAAPGYPMYYLNVMAGPGADRSMVFCDDPAHAWVRESWSAQETDPRLRGRPSG